MKVSFILFNFFLFVDHLKHKITDFLVLQQHFILGCDYLETVQSYIERNYASSAIAEETYLERVIDDGEWREFFDEERMQRGIRHCRKLKMSGDYAEPYFWKNFLQYSAHTSEECEIQGIRYLAKKYMRTIRYSSVFYQNKLEKKSKEAPENIQKNKQNQEANPALLRDIKYSTAFDHPNLNRSYQVIYDPHTEIVVMLEKWSAINLFNFIHFKQQHLIPWEQKIYICYRYLEALGELHSRNYYHSQIISGILQLTKRLQPFIGGLIYVRPISQGQTFRKDVAELGKIMLMLLKNSQNQQPFKSNYYQDLKVNLQPEPCPEELLKKQEDFKAFINECMINEGSQRPVQELLKHPVFAGIKKNIWEDCIPDWYLFSVHIYQEINKRNNKTTKYQFRKRLISMNVGYSIENLHLGMNYKENQAQKEARMKLIYDMLNENLLKKGDFQFMKNNPNYPYDVIDFNSKQKDHVNIVDVDFKAFMGDAKRQLTEYDQQIQQGRDQVEKKLDDLKKLSRNIKTNTMKLEAFTSDYKSKFQKSRRNYKNLMDEMGMKLAEGSQISL